MSHSSKAVSYQLSPSPRQPDQPVEVPVVEATPRTMTHRQEQELKEDPHPIVVKETLKLSDNFNLPEDEE